MANTLLTYQAITFETLMILTNNLKFASNVYRGYDDQFGAKGHKIGTTLNIRKPPRFVGRTGQNVIIEGITDTFVPLVLDTQFGQDTQISSAEMKLSIDDLANRVLKPAAAVISNKIDRDGLALYSKVANCVGVAGITPNTALTYLQAGQKIDEMGAPMDENRTFIINPAARVGIVDASKGLFQDASLIGKQYRTGMIGQGWGGKWYQDQNVNVHTIGTYVSTTAAVSGGGQTGFSLNTKNWTAADALNVGDWFTIGSGATSVYAVNPQSRQSTGALQQFVVTAPFVATGGVDAISIFPPILPSGQFQTVSTSPANNAVLNIWQGTTSPSGVSTPQNLLFHETSFGLACAELDVPGGIDMGYSQRDPETGIALRFVRQYNVPTDQWVSRFDTLYGYVALYPELACRIAG